MTGKPHILPLVLRLFAPLVFLVFVYGSGQAPAEMVNGVQFKADHYERDLQTNVVRGKGNAYLKKDNRQIWADEIEVDFTTKRATAQGSVHLKDSQLDVWCRHASYNLQGEDAIFEEVVLTSGQLVIAGNVVRRLDPMNYIVEEGSYSNCNVDLITKKEVAQCTFDWKLYGRYFSLTVERYAQIQDALVYVREIPVFYLPYLVAPVKTKRQSGLLMPAMTYSENLGNGLRVPYFWAMSSWQDMTLTTSHYSKTGFHFGLNYRYLYSSESYGEANVFLIQRRFSANRANPAPEDGSRERVLGLIGEGAINLSNRFTLGGRTYARQVIRYVSDPYYTVDYGPDLGVAADAIALRNQLAVISPSDRFFRAAKVEHHQSLIVSKDSGVDRGPVTLLPAIFLSQMNTSFLDRYLSWEWDATFINFYRPQEGYDSVPTALNPSDLTHVDPNPEYHDGDYIRTGRRLHIEPRLIANLPLGPGIQLQPQIKPGVFLYQFAQPDSQFSTRQYLDLELPFALYLSKTFDTPWQEYETINHVLQPRFVYARRLFQSGDTTHPFYYRDPSRGLSNPRFDSLDQLIDYEYMRFELVNRFRRKIGRGSERFLRLQLSEQYNLKTDDENPRFSKRVGPIELLGELQIWRFYSQLEGLYQIEMTEANGRSVRENSLSSTLEYRDPKGDKLTLGNRIRINVDESLTEKTVLFSFYKTLPIVFDVEGGLEYSYQRGDLLGARVGLLFASKPRSCWSLHFQFGQDDLRRKFVRFLFALDFGTASSVSPVPEK